MYNMFVSGAEADGTRRKIVSAAVGLFADLGFAAVSVREIAHEAGVHFSVINYHFGSKEALYQECLRYAGSSPRFCEAVSLADESNADGLGLLVQLAARLLDDAEAQSDRGACSRLIAREMMSNSPNTQILMEHWDPGMRMVQRVVARMGGMEADSAEARFYAMAYFSLLVNLGDFRRMLEAELGLEGGELSSEWMAIRVGALFEGLRGRGVGSIGEVGATGGGLPDDEVEVDGDFERSRPGQGDLDVLQSDHVK